MGPTIEEALEKALEQILQHKVELQAASRTDAGVHAEAQVVNFFSQKPLSLNRFQYSLNQILPKEIAIISVEEMKSDFHPTLETKKKEYWYHVCNSQVQSPFFRKTSWHFPYPLNREAMKVAAELFIGTHDFSALCNERKLWDRNPVCYLENITEILG